MPKKTKTPTNPLQGRIDALIAVGLSVEPMKSNRGNWKVCHIGTGVIFQGSRPLGYISQEGAVQDAERLTEKLRRYRRDTDEARKTLDTAIGYTHVTPERMERFRRELVAAREFERTEAVRLGLPVRG